MPQQKTTEERLKELEKRVGKLEEAINGGDAAPAPQRTFKKVSPKEFLMTTLVKTETQKTLALAYYLEYIQGLESFNAQDLVKVFRAAKERPPKNINDAVNKNTSRGFLMDATEKKEDRKAWVLTNTGEKFVKEELIS